VAHVGNNIQFINKLISTTNTNEIQSTGSANPQGHNYS